jgi:hypothetical protein
VSKTTIYFALYGGNTVALYNGSAWAYHTLTERSLSLGTLTSGKNYDVFLYDNSGTLTLELSAAWTNDTTRSDAITTQDGVSVKSGATTRRLVGTIRTTSTTTTEDSVTKRFVWNAANRVARPLLKKKTGTWSYTTGTWRQANTDTSAKVEVVAGDACGAIDLMLSVQIYTTGYACDAGIGLDSTTAPATNCLVGEFYNTGARSQIPAILKDYVSLGYHYYSWLEKTNGGGGTATWGEAAGNDAGLAGVILC